MEHEMSREKTFNMRLSEEEAARFDRVAAHYSLPVASMIRMLIKEKDERISRDAAELRDGTIATLPKSTAAQFARVRARASTEEETGAVLDFPSHLRRAFDDASKGGAGGFKEMGFRVAVAMRQLVEGTEKAESALGSLLEADDGDPLEFLRQFLPRIFERVPKNRLQAFKAGIDQALEQGEV